MFSIGRVGEDLAVLDIPSAQVGVLPGGWRPPADVWVKINIDAAFNSEAGLAGAGGVAPSPMALRGAWCKPHPGSRTR